VASGNGRPKSQKGIKRVGQKGLPECPPKSILGRYGFRPSHFGRQFGCRNISAARFRPSTPASENIDFYCIFSDFGRKNNFGRQPQRILAVNSAVNSAAKLFRPPGQFGRQFGRQIISAVPSIRPTMRPSIRPRTNCDRRFNSADNSAVNSAAN